MLWLNPFVAQLVVIWLLYSFIALPLVNSITHLYLCPAKYKNPRPKQSGLLSMAEKGGHDSSAYSSGEDSEQRSPYTTRQLKVSATLDPGTNLLICVVCVLILPDLVVSLTEWVMLHPIWKKTPLASNSILCPLKYNLLVFKAINFSQPPYLSALIKSRSLTHGKRLSVSSTCPKKRIGRRDFAVAAPAEWNKLPQTVRTQQTMNGFRSQLKTH